MSVDSIATFLAVGAVLTGALVAAGAATALTGRLSAGGSRAWETLVVSAGPSARRLAWGMAVVATLGSLYFSEIAHFEPCTFCWYQRIAMYPLSLILGIAVFSHDRLYARYVVPLTAAGALLSSYHYLIQHFPDLSTGECTATAPCTAAYVWKFGFVSIPLMALVSFAAILLLVSLDLSYLRRNPTP
jgi:disulfide bond formation protein DsbB